MSYHIVVCGSLVPDPLQTLSPVEGPDGPSLKNEGMLPSVLDPWAAHALYEAHNLAKNNHGSKVWLLSLGPKAKLQQLMMSVAQKVPFELVVIDGSASGFTDSYEVAMLLSSAIEGIQGLDKTKLFIFGGMSSASRDSGTTLQMIGEKLGITNQFVGVDELSRENDGTFKILERVEGGKYQSSSLSAPPAVLAWATGNLPEPPNNPQVGMTNMRGIMPSLQKAKKVEIKTGEIKYKSVELPTQQRQTRIVKDVSSDEIAKEIVDWIKK